jgi:hypothetical protein
MIKKDFRKKKIKDEFKREFGVSHIVFAKMIDIIRVFETLKKKKGGKPSKLSIEDKLRMTLNFWKENTTYFKLSKAYNISESACFRNIIWIENTLIKSGKFSLPKKTDVMQDKNITQIAIDATEIPIEKPIKMQKKSYSGKKKRHTIKAQLIIDTNTKQILSISVSDGSTHDFKLCKTKNLTFSPDVEILADSGYQGLQKLKSNVKLPIKKNETVN